MSSLPPAVDQIERCYVVGNPGPYAAEVDLIPEVEEVEDQGQYGTCTSNAACSVCEMIGKMNGVSYDLSRKFPYQISRILGFMPPEIEGAAPIDTLRAMYRYGVPDESDWPYINPNSQELPPQSIFDLAAHKKVGWYETIKRTGDERYLSLAELIQQVKCALSERLPVLIAMDITTSLPEQTGPWREHTYNPNAPSMGWHAMLLIGYSDEYQKFLAQSSWGKNYGDGGFFGIPYYSIGSYLVELSVIRRFANHHKAPLPGIFKARLNKYRLDAAIIPPASKVGSVVNVWIGALLPTGQWLLKTPVGEWLPPVNNLYLPALENVTLPERLDVVVSAGVDLSPYEGAKIYIAYGTSPLDWELGHIATIPNFNLL